MIGAEHEQGRSGSGEGFVDAVSIDFCDPGSGLFGLTWIVSRPNAGSARASALLFEDAREAARFDSDQDAPALRWEDAAVGPIRMKTEAPLERWSIELSAGGFELRLDATALSAPVGLGDPALADLSGIDQYEQLCSVKGSLEREGTRSPVDAVGRRVHCWGEFAWDRIKRWRTLYAASSTGRAVSVATALPPAGGGHDDELRAAALLGDESDTQFDDVRVSTVFAASGLPVKAGLELWPSGEEIPRRLGGESLCGASIERDGHDVSLSFFRWSMEGIPAYGCYEAVERR